MKVFTDNFDKIVMLAVFVAILVCAIYFGFEWLNTLARDAFLVLTALLGFRRQTAPTAQAETIEKVEINDLQNLTVPEAINAVEQIKEEK